MPAPPATARPKRLMPPWLLLGLTLGVSLVHLVALQGGMAALQRPPQPAAPAVFNTRTLPQMQPPPPSAVVPAPTPQGPRAAPLAPKAARPPDAPSKQAVAPESIGDTATNSVASNAPTPADTAPPPPPPPPAAAASEAASPAHPPATATAALATPEAAAPRLALPPPVLFKYQTTLETRGVTNRARAELLWQHDGTRYSAQLTVSHWLAGSRVQTSQGQLTAEGLAPERFSDKFRSEVAAHFERERGVIVFSANTPSAALRPGMQDRLSVFVQLAALFAGDPLRYSALVLPVVGPRNADEWHITVGDIERLALPIGPLDTLKLVRPPQREFDQLLELWLAPALGYLPVRMRLTESNGDVADLRLAEHNVP